MTAPTAQQLRRARMQSLLLDVPAPRTPLAVAEWFGALQAQDAASGHWSLGVRCAGMSEPAIVDAFENGALIRTWPMRGTLHIVPGADASWLLEHVGSRMLSGAARRRAQLGLSLDDAARATAALASHLADRRLITRTEALAIIADIGISVDGGRGYHLLWHSAQTGVTCIGPQRGADQTFALLADWAPPQTSMTKADAHAELLLRFVQSHGPVPLQDFVGWTGLTLSDARSAAAANAGRLTPLGGNHTDALWTTVSMAERLADGGLDPVRLQVLPGFDEFMLGYKNRELQVPAGAFDKIVPGGNGMFRATVVIDGMAAGVWKRTVRGRRVEVSVEPFTALKQKEQRELHTALERYAEFLGCTLDVVID